MDTDYLVSIIIPTYNRSDSLPECLSSVLAQTYKDIEVIVVDDGSRDDTQEILKKFIDSDSRVSYHRYEDNKGASYARNYGMKFSRGKYIAFHDSDEIMLKNRIEYQVQSIKKHCVDMVFARVRRINNITGREDILPEYYKGIKYDYYSLLLNGIVWTGTILGTSSSIKDISFDENLQNRVDYDWSIRYVKKYTAFFDDIIVSDSYVGTSNISQNQINALESTEIMLNKYYSDISSRRDILTKWKKEIAQFKWNMECCSGKDAFEIFLLTYNYSWLLKSILLTLFHNHAYKIKNMRKNQ